MRDSSETSSEILLRQLADQNDNCEPSDQKSNGSTLMSKEIDREALRKTLKELADKVSPESLQPAKLPSWFTNRDIPNGKPKCDPDKIAPTVVMMAIESVFQSQHLRPVTVLEEDEILKVSEKASVLPQNWQQSCYPNAGGIIRENNNGNPVPKNNKDSLDAEKTGEIIKAWNNGGMIIRDKTTIFDAKNGSKLPVENTIFQKNKYKRAAR